MYYLYSDAIDWGDEFDVHFGELIDEETYQKYKYMQDTLKTFVGCFAFGTNEDFDDFEYLEAQFTPIPDSDAEVLEKYGLPNGEGFLYRLFQDLTSRLIELFPEDCHKTTKYPRIVLNDDLLECSFEKFKYYINKLVKHNG